MLRLRFFFKKSEHGTFMTHKKQSYYKIHILTCGKNNEPLILDIVSKMTPVNHSWTFLSAALESMALEL